MKMYKLENRLLLPTSIEEAWAFLANPAQLENITSDDLSFRVLDSLPDEMVEGMLVRYQIRPFPLIRLNWVAEITYIDEGFRFIDEQRFGPFRFWHHEHQIIEVENGIEMKDTVHYVMPFSIIGRIVHRLLIRNMLENIFDYRNEEIRSMFE
jgi:ligand-binding SRPBCC domain-containing protein